VSITVRKEQPRDAAAIAALTTAAFAKKEYSFGDEASMIERLRESGDMALSLVAVNMDDAVIGHAAFSPVTISDGTQGWYGLGPISVIPLRQRAGIGSMLVEAGLEELRRIGAKGCAVLGNGELYARFGFEHDPGLYLAGAPPEHFHRLVLKGEAPHGEVKYSPAFYWAAWTNSRGE
jgi:putative acetyltransferase